MTTAYDHDHERDEGGDVEDGGGYDDVVDCDDIDNITRRHNILYV